MLDESRRRAPSSGKASAIFSRTTSSVRGARSSRDRRYEAVKFSLGRLGRAELIGDCLDLSR